MWRCLGHTNVRKIVLNHLHQHGPNLQYNQSVAKSKGGPVDIRLHQRVRQVNHKDDYRHVVNARF